MDSDLRRRIEDLLLALPGWDRYNDRHVLLKGHLGGHPIWQDLQTDGSPKNVARRLLDLCSDPNRPLRGHPPPICVLLAGLSNDRAAHPAHIAEISDLTARLCQGRRARPRPVWNRAPYRGLAFFDRRHAPIFFGRDAEVQDLIETLTTEQGRRLCVVIGASGSGKSSLVRAGLWARLEQGQVPELPGSADWLIAAMTPTDLDTPLGSLRAAAVAAIRDQESFDDRRGFDWGRAMAEIKDGTRSLAAVAQELLDGHPQSRWLLILDQMEELFTTVPKDQATVFIDLLIEATKPTAAGGDPPLQVLATLRADFFHHCLLHPSLKRSLVRDGGKFLLGPPDLTALIEMVAGPLTEVNLLERSGDGGDPVPLRWSLDPGLANRIAADADRREGGLALMAFALQELYRVCRPHRRLALATYESPEFGGLGGAIARRAEATLRELGEDWQPVLQRVFAQLVQVSEDEPPTRGRERLAFWDADPDAVRLIQVFVKARLLVAAAKPGEPPTVEVAHEALLREWPKLADWIGSRRDAFRLCERVRTEARAWVEGDLHRHVRRPWPGDTIGDIRHRLAETGLLDQLLQEPPVADLLTSEADWLLAQLCCTATDHQRRRDIGQRLAEIGDPRPGVGVVAGLPNILWCPIPGGEVTIKGHGRFKVAPFHMAAYPTTFAQFRCCLKSIQEDMFDFDEGSFSKLLYMLEKYDIGDRDNVWNVGLDNHPLTDCPWDSAAGYCGWLSVCLGIEVRLPNEWEWQWAAQGARKAFVYPWGSEWRAGLANTQESGIGRSTAVGMYPHGASGQGVYDLAGNVWEWCANGYEDPRAPAKGCYYDYGSRVSRGGSWDHDLGNACATRRVGLDVEFRGAHNGFRVVCVAPIR